MGRHKSRGRKRSGIDRFSAGGFIGNIDLSLNSETKKGIFIVFLFALGVISLLSYFKLAGSAGEWINETLAMVFGAGKIIFPIIVIVWAYILLNQAKYEIKFTNYLGAILFILTLCGLLHWKAPVNEIFERAAQGQGGGFVGGAVNYPLFMILGKWASLVIVVALFIISILLMFNTSFSNILEKSAFIRKIWFFIIGIFDKIFKRKPAERAYEQEYEGKETEEKSEEEDKKASFASKKIKEYQPKEPKQAGQTDFGITIPKSKSTITIPVDLLENKTGKPTSGDIKNHIYIIKKTLENFGINVEMGDVSVGPTVTQYTLKPSEGVKLAKIVALQNDLALALAAHPIRIEAPIPGRSLVGIEVPNQKIAQVSLREILDSKEFKHRDVNLTLALGKDVSGKAWIANLERMPHLLIAGATGSGKTVCVNSIIVSLLYQNSPQNLRFIMVDPKRVELPCYNGIPHLLTPVITDVKKTVNALKWTIGEMERRFDVLSKAGKRNIQTYNASASEKLPNIVFIIDELADLMASSAAEVEGGIIRLAQMARAVGIHLVLATQRPSVDVITGLMKANIPARIAFSVASLIDSRTILDSSGAEKLLGRGDMLFLTAELSKPKRIQGVFVSDDEIKRVVDFLKEAGDEPEYVEEVVEKQKGIIIPGVASDGDEDDLIPDAKEVIISAGKASASLLQRRLKVGYARAARLLDILEDRGFIGPADGAKPREILAGAETAGIQIEENIGTENNEENYQEEREIGIEDGIEKSIEEIEEER